MVTIAIWLKGKPNRTYQLFIIKRLKIVKIETYATMMMGCDDFKNIIISTHNAVLFFFHSHTLKQLNAKSKKKRNFNQIWEQQRIEHIKWINFCLDDHHWIFFFPQLIHFLWNKSRFDQNQPDESLHWVEYLFVTSWFILRQNVDL